MSPHPEAAGTALGSLISPQPELHSPRSPRPHSQEGPGDPKSAKTSPESSCASRSPRRESQSGAAGALRPRVSMITQRSLWPALEDRAVTLVGWRCRGGESIPAARRRSGRSSMVRERCVSARLYGGRRSSPRSVVRAGRRGAEAAMAAMAGAGPGPAEGPCVLCCGELDVVALGRCEHPICYRCSVRMRALCGVRYCAVCREELRQVRPGPGLGGPRAGRGSSGARGGRGRCSVEAAGMDGSGYPPAAPLLGVPPPPERVAN